MAYLYIFHCQSHEYRKSSKKSTYSFHKLYVLPSFFRLRINFKRSPAEGPHPGVSHIYNCRHTTHKLATDYTRVCRLFTRCVAYSPNVSLSRFGECVTVGIPCTDTYDLLEISKSIKTGKHGDRTSFGRQVHFLSKTWSSLKDSRWSFKDERGAL